MLGLSPRNSSPRFPKRGHFLWNGPRPTGLAVSICQGSGWVCENHPTKAWTQKEGGCQCGAGNNRANGEDTPDVEGVIEEIEEGKALRIVRDEDQDYLGHSERTLSAA